MRGGVPVAFEVATALNLRLDVLLVRKLGVPTHEEYAMGAIASGGIQITNEEALRERNVDRSTFNAVVARETQELLRRERVYRGTHAPEVLKAQQVILIDDGLATGYSMMAAIEAVRLQEPSRIVVAVPVAPLDTAETLLRLVTEEVVCPLTPERLISISYWYMDFTQTSDEEVVALLQRAWKRKPDVKAR